MTEDLLDDREMMALLVMLQNKDCDVFQVTILYAYADGSGRKQGIQHRAPILDVIG